MILWFSWILMDSWEFWEQIFENKGGKPTKLLISQLLIALK